MTDGSIVRDDDRVTFRYERHLRQPIETVWRAITEPAEIERWAGTRPEIDLVPGGAYVTHHGTGDRVVDRIVRLDPPRLFAHTFWAHVNPSAVVTWELTPVGDGCRLVLTHTLAMDDVRAAAATVAMNDHPAVIIARNGAGWHHLLDRLDALLDRRDLPWTADDQRALQDRYAAMIG